jgi:hypothetical protein
MVKAVMDSFLPAICAAMALTDWLPNPCRSFLNSATLPSARAELICVLKASASSVVSERLSLYLGALPRHWLEETWPQTMLDCRASSAPVSLVLAAI